MAEETSRRWRWLMARIDRADAARDAAFACRSSATRASAANFALWRAWAVARRAQRGANRAVHSSGTTGDEPRHAGGTCGGAQTSRALPCTEPRRAWLPTPPTLPTPPRAAKRRW